MAAEPDDTWESLKDALRERRINHPYETHLQTANALGVSRAWVGKHIRRLQDEGVLPEPATAEHMGRALVGVGKATAGESGGRKTAFPGLSGLASSGLLQTVLPPPDERGRWADYGLDQKSWDRLGTRELLRLLRQISPDFSRAVWDYLRLANAGFEIIAYDTNDPDGKKTSDRGQEAVGEILDLMDDYYGGFKVQANRAFTNYLLRGAVLVELVLDRSGRRPVDLVVPDSSIIRFRKVDGGDRGPVWQIGQWLKGEFIPLDQPTIGYIAVDPEPDNPYGTPLFTPSIFPLLFLMGLMQDLRRVVAQQGYPRTDIVVRMDQVKAMLDKTGDDELLELGKKMVAEVMAFYGTLEPDDAFAHTDFVDVKTNGGAIATNVLQATKPLIDSLERQAMRALKSTPLMMGFMEGASEATANRQWEVWAQYITSMQQDVENNFSARISLGLEVQGIPARAEVRFHPVRAADEQRDEQTFALKIANAAAARDQGFWSQEQASLHAVGEPPDQEEAPEPAPVTVVDAGDGVDEDGADATKAKALAERVLELIEVDYRIVAVSDVDAGDIDDAADEWADVFDGEDVETLLNAELRNAPEDGDGD